MGVITYPCWELKLNHVSKSGPWISEGCLICQQQHHPHYLLQEIMCYLVFVLRPQRLCGDRHEWMEEALNHLGQVTHICASKLTINGSDNGLSSGRCQAIIWTNVAILLIAPLGTNFSEIVIRIKTFLKYSWKKRLQNCFVLYID